MSFFKNLIKDVQKLKDEAGIPRNPDLAKLAEQFGAAVEKAVTVGEKVVTVLGKELSGKKAGNPLDMFTKVDKLPEAPEEVDMSKLEPAKHQDLDLGDAAKPAKKKTKRATKPRVKKAK